MQRANELACGHFLAELADLAARPSVSERGLRLALSRLCQVSGAFDAWLLVAAEDHTAPVTCIGPAAKLWNHGFTYDGLLILRRWMADHAPHVGFRMTRADRKVREKMAAAPGLPRPFFAFQLVVPETSVEALIVRGPWGVGGIPAETLALLKASVPGFSTLVMRFIGQQRSSRFEKQLDALASMAHILMNTKDMETALTELATITSAVTGFSFVTIDVYDRGLETIALRCVAQNRYMQFDNLQRWIEARAKGDPLGSRALAEGAPLYIEDLQSDPRAPESSHVFAKRNLLRSAAVVPLVFGGERLGVLSLTGFETREFDPALRQLIGTLAGQISTAIKALTLFSQLKESEQRLRELNERLQENMEVQHRLARTDALTGLPNRRYLEEALGAEVARAHRHGGPLAVAIFDVDHFKTVNDVNGHAAGDETLRVIASMAREVARSSDLVGRFGGDEFVFLLPQTDADGASELVWRLVREVRAKWTSPRVTLSAGIAALLPGESADSLLARADAALYEAKNAGRDTVRVALPPAEAAELRKAG
ncbi:MAG TPA: sensor domain-containing diguanylate cyclase [Dehalococcoidia bacterium]|nr:sensor domain-containing diguanylate cyclase [Dehalococcoidia bacterium]